MKFLSAAAAVLLFTVSFSAQIKISLPSASPVFAAPAMDGRMIDIAQLRGKVVVINLWFVNCPNCVAEIKLLNELVEQYKNNDEIVFIAPAASTKPLLEKFLAKNPFKYDVIPNAMAIILGKFGTPDKNGEINIPFPMHYVMNREGKIVVEAQGIKGIDSVKKELTRQFPQNASAAK